MKNKTITLLLISMITILSIAGCGKKDGSSSDNGSTSSYTSAVEILNVIWDNFPESDKFEVIGGGIWKRKRPVCRACRAASCPPCCRC